MNDAGVVRQKDDLRSNAN